MASRILILMVFSIIATNFSCKKKQKVEIPVNTENIQGNWKHQYEIEPNFTTPPEFELIRFVNDSFYLRLRWTREIITTSCPESTGRNYVKGKYKLKEGKIYFFGVFTTSEYITNLDSSGCLSVGNWVDSFRVSLTSLEILSFYWLIPISSMPEEHRKIKLLKID